MIATLYANDPAAWPLRAGVVHVWQFAWDAATAVAPDALSDDEHAIAARFVFERHRHAYRIQHAALREILAKYAGATPGALAFARGRNGKPLLVGDAVAFNLSHADDAALVAVALPPLAVGIDIERVKVDLDPAELGRTVLAPDEAPLARDRRGFLRIWCRKEACLKATGVGLIDDLPSVSVAADRVDVAGEIVYVQDLAVGDAHAGALATTSPVAPIRAQPIEVLAIE